MPSGDLIYPCHYDLPQEGSQPLRREIIFAPGEDPILFESGRVHLEIDKRLESLGWTQAQRAAVFDTGPNAVSQYRQRHARAARRETVDVVGLLPKVWSLTEAERGHYMGVFCLRDLMYAHNKLMLRGAALQGYYKTRKELEATSSSRPYGMVVTFNPEHRQWLVRARTKLEAERKILWTEHLTP